LSFFSFSRISYGIPVSAVMAQSASLVVIQPKPSGVIMRNVTFRCLFVLLLALVVFSGCGSDDVLVIPEPGDTTAPDPVSDLATASAAAGRITLTWTATGDNGAEGTAASYEIRYTTYPSDVYGWKDWTIFTTSAPASPSGQAEVLEITDLTADVAYVFRLKVVDAAGNTSETSNPVVATAAVQFDTSAPDPVSDLTMWEREDESMTVTWSPAADDGPLGLAAAYSIRYADFLIDQSNWDTAVEVTAPTPSGNLRDVATISGIESQTVYYVALRASDEQGNWSDLSNVLQVSTDHMRTWYIKSDGSGDMPTIQSAVSAAGVGDVIMVAPGRYTWTNQDTESSSLKDYAMVMFWRDVDGFTMRSEAGPTETILDAEGKGRVMQLQAYNDNVIVDGFTLTGGNAILAPFGFEGGGALILHLTAPLIRNCIMSNNLATYGGAVEMAGECEATFENCQFVDNEARYGGALYGIKSHPTTTFSECVFAGNTAAISGGAVVSDTTSIWLEDCLIYDNEAGETGGAFLFIRSNPCHLTGCTIVDNRALSDNAIQLRNGSPVAVMNCIIANNGLYRGPFSMDGTSTLSVRCSNIFGHPGGNALLPEIQDQGGNIFLDPGFVDEDNFDFHLLPTSPCLSGEIGCGQIGALGLGGN
jgi:Right handed beta helix region/Fibronectin type III domain